MSTAKRKKSARCLPAACTRLLTGVILIDFTCNRWQALPSRLLHTQIRTECISQCSHQETLHGIRHLRTGHESDRGRLAYARAWGTKTYLARLQPALIALPFTPHRRRHCSPMLPLDPHGKLQTLWRFCGDRFRASQRHRGALHLCETHTHTRTRTSTSHKCKTGRWIDK